jgi:hypothetical protein
VLTEKNELRNVADCNNLLPEVGDDNGTIETTSIKTISSSSINGDNKDYSMFQYFNDTPVEIGTETVGGCSCIFNIGREKRD